MPMPVPSVPDLKPENYIDLDELGNANLLTYISFPAMVDGSTFWPNWRGCSPTGEVVDFFDTLIESDVDYPAQVLVTVGNAQLKALDQGWVFYSYQLEDVSTPDHRGEESLRRFFYVGQRAVSGNALAVPQCKESHDLCLDPAVLNAVASVSIVTLPYRAMQAGDKVTLTLDRYFGVGVPWQPLTLNKTLTAEEPGQPLQWAVEPTELLIIMDGYALMSYSIEYADPTLPTVSAEQTLTIIAPASALLPALTIKELPADWLDPEDWPDGVILVITVYPGIQVGDDVVLYVSGGLTPVVKTLRVDPSTIASGVLQFNLEYVWLSDNQGRTVELIYQYARVGSAGTSQPFELTLHRRQALPPPEVLGAQPEDSEPGEFKGYILASNATSGVTIDVPGEVDLGPGDTLKMHWEGHPGTGSHIGDPIVGNPKSFRIPAAAVPANMGKRVNVYYTLTPSGETANKSIPYDLAVKPIDDNWPVIQAVNPRATNGRLPLNQVPLEGARFELDSWTFMAEGQRVKIEAVGLLADGQLERVGVRVGDDERVTEHEYYEGMLTVFVPLQFLSRLKLDDENLAITVETSFDGGLNYLSFPGVPDLMVISGTQPEPDALGCNVHQGD